MKCLLCSFESQDQKKLLEHYLTYHNIDSKNCFFQKLFQSDNRPFLKNGVRCKQFLTSRKEKATHDFLKHYSDGKDIEKYGLTNENLEFVDFSQSDYCKEIMQSNDLKIHIGTGNIYYNDTDTNESIC